MSDVIYPDKSYRIIGACFEVYNRKGHGFQEPIYQECLEHELKHREIPFEPQKQIDMFYREKKLKNYFRPDVLCYGEIILEIKAKKELVEEDTSQVLNYLHATELNLGLLVNFGHSDDLKYKRIVL